MIKGDNILNYDKMIYKIIRKYCYNKSDFEDLYQEGMYALQRAQKNYIEGSNADFSSYAYIYIKGEILKYIRENKLIKVSRDAIKLNSLIANAKDKLEQHYGRSVSLEEVSQFLEIPIQKINDAINCNQYVKSLDYVLSDDGKEMDIYDCVGYDEYSFNPEIIDLKEELRKLDTEEKKIINLRYFEGRTQQEISDMLGISQVQVSRKEGKILKKLNNNLVA